MRMHGGVSYPALVLQSIGKPYDLLPSQKGASVFPGGASLSLPPLATFESLCSHWPSRPPMGLGHGEPKLDP